MKTKREAFATHAGLDLSETEDYRYHYGHTSQPVWAFDQTYYSVTKGNQKPAVYRDGSERWQWEEIPDPHLAKFGYKIWKQK